MAKQQVRNQDLASDVFRRNQLVNGGMTNWQRGNGPFTASGYTLDRWYFSGSGTDTYSASKDTTNVDVGALACAAVTFTLGTGAGNSNLQQVLKTSADGNNIRGLNIAFSARVRTSTVNAIQVALTSDGTGAITHLSSYHPGDGTYQTLTATLTVPTDATYVIVYIRFSVSCTAYLCKTMLVTGAVAADYNPLPPADDLARSLRYYQRIVIGSGPYIGSGQAFATANALIYVPREPMGSTPTVTLSAASDFQVLTQNGSGSACSTISVSTNSMYGTMLTLVTSTANLVTGSATVLGGATAAAWIAFEWNP